MRRLLFIFLALFLVHCSDAFPERVVLARSDGGFGSVIGTTPTDPTPSLDASVSLDATSEPDGTPSPLPPIDAPSATDGEHWCLLTDDAPTACMPHRVTWNSDTAGVIDNTISITLSSNRCSWIMDGKKYSGYSTSDRAYMHGDMTLVADGSAAGTFQFMHLMWEDPSRP